ncbi:hypothetical protein FRX31_020842 [Thalictrum thalictroides]|uniref:Uncharacterized protein n=1 Tax=Thalictrum thalictroides TaxID=46969 RepID=A0A7J6VYA4_THATH|nr:hypothetical protein FRX31_020842 [Thalictrum thalictroides]
MELNNSINLGTFIIAFLNPDDGCLIFATDSRSSTINSVTQELTVVADNVRKFHVFHPFVVLFAGDSMDANKVFNDVTDEFNRKIPLTLQEFEAYVNSSICKFSEGKSNDQWKNSFILGSVRIVDNVFVDKYLVMIQKLQDPVHVLKGAIGDGVNAMFPLEDVKWDNINHVQNEIIKNFAHVFYCLDTCGGAIEMLTLSLKIKEKNGSNVVKVLDEDHIIEWPEKMCDQRGIEYKVSDRFYESDTSGKVLQDKDGHKIKKPNARISNKGPQQTNNLLEYRYIMARMKKLDKIKVKLDEKLFVEKA